MTVLIIGETGTLRQRLEHARQDRDLKARVKAAACTYCGAWTCPHSRLKDRGDHTWHRE